jgi:Zn-dependent M28 family amino/carboxypeptidase
MQAKLPHILLPILILLVAIYLVTSLPNRTQQLFDGKRAYQHVLAQTAFGPRTPTSPAHAQAILYIQTELKKTGWQVELQKGEKLGHTLINLLATRQKDPPLLLVAHYDSRFYADNDPNPANQTLPVPGANDGASGVAILLELAQVLPPDAPVGLVFVDGEDQGRIDGWDWILGSRLFAEALPYQPAAVVIVDMLGDADLNIYQEKNSDPELTDSLWLTAKRLGYDQFFIAESKYRVIDDHVPFLEKGIRAVDLIDLDYAYWHTLQDTSDKVSPQSLQIVGEVLLAWIDEFDSWK